MKKLLYRLRWGLIGLVEGVLIFELTFVLFPRWIPPTIQAMALRGPFGKCLDQYRSFYRPWRESSLLKKTDVTISHHPEFGPHRIQTRQVGSLDLWVRDAHPVGPWDILALGDSFAFGYGVTEEDTFVSRMEQSAGWNILNAGAPHWSSGDMRRFLETFLDALKPKKVIYFIYANDFSDEAAKFPQRVRYDRYLSDLVDTPSSPAPTGDSEALAKEPAFKAHRGFRAWLSKHSVLYELLKMVFKLGDYRELGVRKMIHETHHGPMGLWPSFLTGPDHAFSKTHELGRTILERDIHAMADFTRKRKIPLILIYVPCREQVYYDDRMTADMASLGVSPEQSKRLVGHAVSDLTEMAAQNRLPFYDLTPDLRKKRDEEPLYFYHDRHFSPAGHAAAAEAVVHFLRSVQNKK